MPSTHSCGLHRNRILHLCVLQSSASLHSFSECCRPEFSPADLFQRVFAEDSTAAFLCVAASGPMLLRISGSIPTAPSHILVPVTRNISNCIAETTGHPEIRTASFAIAARLHELLHLGLSIVQGLSLTPCFPTVEHHTRFLNAQD